MRLSWGWVLLVACSTTTTVPPRKLAQPPTAPQPRLPPPPPSTVADPSSVTNEGWRTVLPAPAHPSIHWATGTRDGGVLAMTDEGPRRVDGDRWVRTRLRPTEPTRDAFGTRDCHIVRRRDGRDFGAPREQPGDRCADRDRATHVFADADDHPVVRVGTGRVLRWKSSRRRMGHDDPADPSEPVGLVIRGAGSGWQPVGGAVPPELVAVLPTDPPILVGREGDVSVLEDGVDLDRARPIVTTPRPRPLLVLELERELLVVRSDGVWRGTRSLELDGPTRAWLERTADTADHARRIIGVPVSGGAIVGAGTGLLLVDDEHTELVDLGESGQTPDWVGEVWGLTRDGEGWLMLTHNGVVVRGLGARWRRIGHLGDTQSPPEVSHPIGAFRGADGRTRFVDARFEMICAEGDSLGACGPATMLRERRTTQLPDGLLVDDQSIDLHLVSESGARELSLPLPRLRHVFHAGRTDDIFALTDGIVQHLQDGQWHAVASIPDGPEPRTFTVTDDALVVGRAGGEVIARPLRGD